MQSLETVTINNPKDPKSYIVINARDFDPKKHERWSDRKAEPTPEIDPVVPGPDSIPAAPPLIDPVVPPPVTAPPSIPDFSQGAAKAPKAKK